MWFNSQKQPAQSDVNLRFVTIDYFINYSLVHVIENYSWTEVRSSATSLPPPPFPLKGAPLEGKRPKFTDFPSDSRDPGDGGRGWRQLGWFYDERNASPCQPAPVRVARSRDVNFTVFMNIYINLHFTAASAATQRARGGLGEKRERKGGRGEGEKKRKNSACARAHDDVSVESPSFIRATKEAAREDEKLG